MPVPSRIHVVATPEAAATILHPLRRRLLAELGDADSAAGLARRLRLPRQQLNYHLRALEKHGLLAKAGERKRRNCTERLFIAVARSYVISPAALGRLGTDPEPVRDHVSSGYLLGAAAETLRDVAELREQAGASGRRPATLAIQSELRLESPEAQHAFSEALSAAVARVIEAFHADRAPAGRRYRVLIGAYPVTSPELPAPGEAIALTGEPSSPPGAP